jgi:hypothetical protein
MNRYREAARIFWNNFLLSPDVDFDTVDSFDQIRAQMFKLLVLEHLGLVAKGAAASLDITHFVLEPVQPFNFIRVVPVSDPVPVIINRALPDTGYWDASPTEIARSNAELHYDDCFDWDLRGFREFAYYRVRIRDFKGRPDLENRAALMSVEHCRVFAVEP